jgi:peptidyl-tRNA hydrolase
MSGYDPAAAERDAVPQYALPLVVRVERESPPGRTDALEAAAKAVLALLSDPRASAGSTESTGDTADTADTAAGEWAPAVRAWMDGRIRKVVRRARGAAWRRAELLPGITVTHGTAQVRVYPPVPVDEWPPDLARLQVSGTELTDDEPPATPPPPTPVLWENPRLTITAGKAMAQAGHAAQLAWLALPEAERRRWQTKGFPLAVRTATPEQWKELLDSGLPVVRDGGFTEVEPGTATFVADLPALPRGV